MTVPAQDEGQKYQTGHVGQCAQQAKHTMVNHSVDVLTMKVGLVLHNVRVRLATPFFDKAYALRPPVADPGAFLNHVKAALPHVDSCTDGGVNNIPGCFLIRQYRVNFGNSNRYALFGHLDDFRRKVKNQNGADCKQGRSTVYRGTRTPAIQVPTKHNQATDQNPGK